MPDERVMYFGTGKRRCVGEIFARPQGGNSIEKLWLEFRLEKPLELLLETYNITLTKK